MKKTTLALIALATTLSLSSVVRADPPPWAHAHGHEHRDNEDGDGWQGERERHWDHDRYDRGAYKKPRGYERHQWHRGDRLPDNYRSRRYVVQDYRAYHLAPPPRGHVWVRVDNDIVLSAITTGVVAAVVYDIFN